MGKILELLDFLTERSEYYGGVAFDKRLCDLMIEAREEYKDTLPSPLPDDFVEIG